LTTLVELRDVLCEERLREILDRAAGRTEDQVKELVGALAPRPAPPDVLRRLPEPRSSAAAATSPGPDLPLLAATRSGPAPPPRQPPRIEPISEDLRVLRVTVSRAFVADLEAARAALSHQIPDRSLEAVLHECIRRTLADCDRRRKGTGLPPRRPSHAIGRYIAASVRDAVWRRDDGRCTFVGTAGTRCGSTYQVQVHHIHPFANGGPATVDNLALLCAGHNRYQAERDFGAARIARAMAP